MLNLIKPKRLVAGDTIATVSLSWGGAGDEAIRWRYFQGKERLEKVFGLKVVEMPHTLAGTEFVYAYPHKRAQDLMNAFKDPSIKGGLSSFYGMSVLNDFAENVEMSDYSIEWINKVLFSGEVIGEIPTSKQWTSQRLEWIIENKHMRRQFEANTGYELIQGSQTVRGRLIGGCMEVIEYIKGTSLFPSADCFDDAILFLETSEVLPPIWFMEDTLRNYGMMGILKRLNGIIFGKPQGNQFYEEYKPILKQVLAEFGLENMPVLYNASFGHNEPKCYMPYGALAEINCERKSFSILESGVL